jgi:hypothetical protein
MIENTAALAICGNQQWAPSLGAPPLNYNLQLQQQMIMQQMMLPRESGYNVQGHTIFSANHSFLP